MIVHLGSLLDHSDPQSPHLQGGDNKTKYTDCHEDGMGQYMQSSCPVASTLQTMAAALPALVPARHRHSRLRHSRSSARLQPHPSAQPVFHALLSRSLASLPFTTSPPQPRPLPWPLPRRPFQNAAATPCRQEQILELSGSPGIWLSPGSATR